MAEQIVLGMDLETNGSAVPSAAPIQIGIYGYAPNGGNVAYESMIFWPNITRKDWCAKGEEIHGFSWDNFVESGQHATKVTGEIEDLFGGFSIRKPWVVGFNVAGYDLTVLRDWHQPLWNLFSHRSVDLNAIIKFLAAIGLSRADSPKPWSFASLKKRVKQLAATKLEADGWDPSNAHDAFYDAMLAYECWGILQQIMEPYAGLLRQSKEGLL